MPHRYRSVTVHQPADAALDRTSTATDNAASQTKGHHHRRHAHPNPLSQLDCGLHLEVQGHSIVVVLEGEQLGALCQLGDGESPRVSVLRREAAEWTEPELALLIGFRAGWLSGQRMGGRCRYDITQEVKPGGKSNFIGGDLARFVADARAELADAFGCEMQHPAHVTLRLANETGDT